MPSLDRARDARGDICLGRNVAQQTVPVWRERETVTLTREQRQPLNLQLNQMSFGFLEKVGKSFDMSIEHVPVLTER